MERPLERRTAARTAVVWDAVRTLLEERAQSDHEQGDHEQGDHAQGNPERGDREQVVLDIGGGTGGFAVRVAALERPDGTPGPMARVTVVDPSPDALATLARRADDEDVADRVTGLQGDLTDLPGLVPLAGADLVLCHGVLGLVTDPTEALATIAATLRPGGVLSLVVSQRHAAVLARAMAGHFQQAKAMLDAVPGDGSGDRRFTVEEVAALLAEAGLQLQQVQGIRVFADLVPSSLLDLEPGAAAALLELERAVAGRPEYLTIAGQLHLVATR